MSGKLICAQNESLLWFDGRIYNDVLSCCTGGLIAIGLFALASLLEASAIYGINVQYVNQTKQATDFFFFFFFVAALLRLQRIQIC